MLKNLEHEIGNLRKKIKKAGDDKAKLTIVALLADLKTATPVDTGLAQSSWTARQISNVTTVVQNNVPYIRYLNEGSSEKAPAFFVERVALKYGRPVGKITK